MLEVRAESNSVENEMFHQVSTKEDKVHVVLPEGYTTKGSPPERSTTKPPRSRRKPHPLSTTMTVTTTGPARNTFRDPTDVNSVASFSQLIKPLIKKNHEFTRKYSIITLK